ncbi:MAG: hypothetical protein ACYCQJ_16075 [Nitrososphaerales archaeon]
MSPDSRTKYIKLMQRINDVLSPDRVDRDKYLYWHEFTKPSNHRIVVDALKSHYSAKDIPIKIVIIIKCLEKVPKFPAPDLLQWRALLDAEKHEADKIENVPENVPDWREELSKLARNIAYRSANHNTRTIAYLYLNGLVLRPKEILLTKYRGTVDDQQNYLDLSTGKWVINEPATKTFSRAFIIPKTMCEQIKKYVNPKSEYLLSRINGSPYKDWNSFNKTWKKYTEHEAYDFRRSFVTWFNNFEGNDSASASKLAYVLGHSLKTNQVNYTVRMEPSKPLDFVPGIYDTIIVDIGYVTWYLV